MPHFFKFIFFCFCFYRLKHEAAYLGFFFVLDMLLMLLVILSDSSGMWEDNDVEDGEDGEDEDEDEGLAGQLLSDLIASNKYGTIKSQLGLCGWCLDQSAHEFLLLVLLLCHRR